MSTSIATKEQVSTAPNILSEMTVICHQTGREVTAIFDPNHGWHCDCPSHRTCPDQIPTLANPLRRRNLNL